MNTWWIVLPAFVILDLLLGDPEKPFHPIRLMGKTIAFLEPIFRKRIRGEQFAGTLFVFLLVTGVWTLTYGIISLADNFSHELATVVEIIVLFYTISIHTLILAGLTVYEHLKNGHIENARHSVSMIVGRDTQSLEKTGLVRATIETIAENFVDGIVSPLLFAAIGGAPLAMAYKMINTLDSMIGYKNDQYRRFGAAAARLDDIANYVPARLSLFWICLGARLCGFSSENAWKTAMKEGRNHPSPNAGYPEAAFAGALGVRLNGPSTYHGKLVSKPFIGMQYPEPGSNHILQACGLVLMASLWTTAFVWVFGLFINGIVSG